MLKSNIGKDRNILSSLTVSKNRVQEFLQEYKNTMYPKDEINDKIYSVNQNNGIKTSREIQLTIKRKFKWNNVDWHRY